LGGKGRLTKDKIDQLQRYYGSAILYRGQVINFPQDVKVFASSLPHRIMDLTSVLTVRFKNQKEGTETFINFHVGAKKVRDALTWLKINNPYYQDISISDENLTLLPDNGDMSASILSILKMIMVICSLKLTMLITMNRCVKCCIRYKK
jgi:hypothetical protein